MAVERTWFEFKDLLTRPLAWLVSLPFAALAAAQMLVMSDAFNSPDGGRDTRIGLYLTGFAMLSFLLRIVVRFILSRQLGSDESREAPAGWRYVFYSLGYEWLLGLVATIYPMIAANLAMSSVHLFSGLQFAIRVVVIVALLSVTVRLVATAHSGNRLRHRTIREGLSPGHYATFAALAVVPFAIQWGLGAMLAYGSIPLVVASSALSALAHVLLLLFPIAIYCCLDQHGGHEAKVFT